MKLVILVLGLMILATVEAREILVLDLSPATRNSQIGYGHGVEATFAINKEMGRAWLDIIVIEEKTYSQSPRHKYEVKVSGLTFDEDTNKVTLVNDGQLFECATVLHGGPIFRVERVKPTGSCKFKHRYVKVPFDDGRRTGTTTRLQIFLDLF